MTPRQWGAATSAAHVTHVLHETPIFGAFNETSAEERHLHAAIKDHPLYIGYEPQYITASRFTKTAGFSPKITWMFSLLLNCWRIDATLRAELAREYLGSA